MCIGAICHSGSRFRLAVSAFKRCHYSSFMDDCLRGRRHYMSASVVGSLSNRATGMQTRYTSYGYSSAGTNTSDVTSGNEDILSETTSSASKVWEWVPPDATRLDVDTNISRAGTTDRSQNRGYTIPVIEGILLTPDEVKLYLEAQGAEDVVLLELPTPLVNITSFVIATGRSLKHLRKLSEAIVIAFKERQVKGKKAGMAVEGGRDDDWQLVDCHEFLVHLMLRDTRKALDIESHWSGKERPQLPVKRSEAEYEAAFSKLLEEHPLPDNYADQSYVPLDTDDLSALGIEGDDVDADSGYANNNNSSNSNSRNSTNDYVERGSSSNGTKTRKSAKGAKTVKRF